MSHKRSDIGHPTPSTYPPIERLSAHKWYTGVGVYIHRKRLTNRPGHPDTPYTPYKGYMSVRPQRLISHYNDGWLELEAYLYMTLLQSHLRSRGLFCWGGA